MLSLRMEIEDGRSMWSRFRELYGLASELRPPGRFTKTLLLSVVGLRSVKLVNMMVGRRCRYSLRQLLEYREKICLVVGRSRGPERFIPP